MKSLSRVRLCVTPWTAAHQASPSMGFSRQEYWSRVPSHATVAELKTDSDGQTLKLRVFILALYRKSGDPCCVGTGD